MFSKDEDVKITEVKDLKNRLIFRIKGEVEESVIIDSEVELDLSTRKGSLPFRFDKITGSVYESLWVQKYIAELCLEI